MRALAYKPKAYWRMDDTAPFTDYSGYNRSATLTGTENHGVALSNNASYSQRLSSAATVTFSSPIYVAGYESNPFTVSAIIEPIYLGTGTTGEQQILGNLNKMDGLTIDGTKISFSTKYTTTGFAKATYDVGVLKRSHVFGVHTATKNSLFVDGILVAEADISQEQQADTFDSPNGNLYSGASSGAQSFLISNVAIHPSALNQKAITDIYNNDARVSQGEISKKYGGDTLLIDTFARQMQMDYIFDTAEEWSSGMLQDCAIDDDTIVANLMGGRTIAGTWKNAINLKLGGVTTTFTSLYFDWEGENVTLAYSSDGVAWTNLTKRVPVTGLTDNVFIKATFTANMTFASLDHLRVFGYTSNNATIESRTITYPAGATMYEPHEVRELNHEWGVKLNGGTITVGADPNLSPRTIEVWLKYNGGTALSRSFTASSTKINGASGSLPTGEWVLVHYNLAAPLSTSFTFSGDITIGQFAFYSAALTDTQIAAIYKSYTGVPTTRITDAGVMTIQEPTTPAEVYAADWEILSA